MNISTQHFHELLQISYEQGYHNGFSDGQDDCVDLNSEDWLSEVVADGEIAGTVIDEWQGV